MKVKKIMSLVLASILTASIVTGCGSDNKGGTNKGGSGTGDSGAVQLEMWVHETDSDEGQLYKALAEEFNEAHAGEIEIVLTQIPRTGDAGGYDDKVNASITTGSMPDVFTIDGPAVAANADAGTIIPIGSYFESDDLADFNNDIIEQGTYEGELYTLGNMDSSVLLFYNKTMFEEAGITAATADDPWTWDELYEAAEKLTKDGVYGFNMGLDDVGEWMTFAYLPLVQSAGGSIVADDGVTVDGYLNSEAVANALNFIQKMVNNGVVSATPEENSFGKESCAILLSGSWQPAGMKDYPDVEWGTMPYPIYEKGAPAASPCGSWTFGVSKDCDNVDAAVEVVKFFTSTDAAVRMFGANSMPPSRSSAFDQIDAFSEAPLDVISYQLQNNAIARPVVVDYPILSDQFAKAVANAANGMSVEDALNDAVDQYNFQTGN